MSDTTSHGTPHAAAWDDDWIALVEQVESKLDRRICGAVGMDGSPCPRESNHPTGRCTHHGGNHLVGGQPGNENARVHGLYARRLQTCDDRCAMWEECPFAANDILAMPKKQRPICVYEQLEYDALVEQYVPEKDGTLPHLHLVHTVALLQVMMSRAATVVSMEPFTEKTSASAENYSMESSKVSASLDAFLRIAREHRHYQRELTRTAGLPPEPKPLAGPPDIMGPRIEKTESILEGAVEFQRKLDARKNKKARITEQERQAKELRDELALNREVVSPEAQALGVTQLSGESLAQFKRQRQKSMKALEVRVAERERMVAEAREAAGLKGPPPADLPEERERSLVSDCATTSGNVAQPPSAVSSAQPPSHHPPDVEEPPIDVAAAFPASEGRVRETLPALASDLHPACPQEDDGRAEKEDHPDQHQSEEGGALPDT